MTKGFDILGLGMATVDILTATPRLPGPDEVFEVTRIELQGGGPVANALAAASKLGSTTSFVGVTDTGHWGDMIADEFNTYGVDMTHLRRHDGVAARSVILIEGGRGQRSILYSQGSVPDLTVDDVPRDELGSARLLHLDGSHADAALTAARAARDSGVPVSLDGGAGELWPGMDALLPLVDVLVVARRFAAQVTGEDDPLDAGPVLAQGGATQVVITDGDAGAWYWQGDESGHVPAFPVQVVDTTGAGDAFHGGYLHALLNGQGIRDRVIFASAVAALVCTELGGRAGLPTRSEADTFIAAHGAQR